MYLNDKWGLGITSYTDGTFNENVYSLGLVATPEPSTLGLLLMGRVMLLGSRKRSHSLS